MVFKMIVSLSSQPQLYLRHVFHKHGDKLLLSYLDVHVRAHRRRVLMAVPRYLDVADDFLRFDGKVFKSRSFFMAEVLIDEVSLLVSMDAALFVDKICWMFLVDFLICNMKQIIL